MANEINVQSSLLVRKGNVNYQSQNPSFRASMAAQNGPTPGVVLVSTDGTDIPLTQLTAMGGMCRLENIDPTNWIEYGIKDSGTGASYFPFYLLPGESTVVRLGLHLQKKEAGTGTFSGTCTLHARANSAAARLFVGAFDP